MGAGSHRRGPRGLRGVRHAVALRITRSIHAQPLRLPNVWRTAPLHAHAEVQSDIDLKPEGRRKRMRTRRGLAVLGVATALAVGGTTTAVAGNGPGAGKTNAPGQANRCERLGHAITVLDERVQTRLEARIARVQEKIATGNLTGEAARAGEEVPRASREPSREAPGADRPPGGEVRREVRVAPQGEVIAGRTTYVVRPVVVAGGGRTRRLP